MRARDPAAALDRARELRRGALLTALLADAPVGVIVPVMVVAGAISMAWNGLSVTAAAELAGTVAQRRRDRLSADDALA